MGTVTDFKQKEAAQKMSDDELKRRDQEITTDTRGYRRARLYAEARNQGRILDEIAAVVGRDRSLVGFLITFADFLTWYEKSTTVDFPEFRPYEVTERKFRGLWNKRKKLKGRENERRRAVLDDLLYHQRERETHNKQRYAELVAALRENKCINGKKYKISTLAKKTGFEEKFIIDFLDKHKSKTAHGLRAEGKVQPHLDLGDNTYKIHPANSKVKVDPRILLSKIQPHLDELDKMGDYNPGSRRIVPITIRQLAFKIQKSIKDLC